MFTLKIENANGEIFELTHNRNNYAVVGVQGLTPPPTTVNTSTGGTVDGVFYNSSRVEQRNLVIDIILNGDIEGNRQRLYRMFNIKRPCTIYFSNKNRNVKIKGYVETLDGDLFSQREQMQISIICPRPFFEDMNIIYTELSKIVAMFEFPFAIEKTGPVPLSEIIEIPVCTIHNGGDVECGFIATVDFNTAPIDFTIYNSTMQTFLGINYLSFLDGDRITINTLSGQMGVTLESGGEKINLLNYLSEGSTWLKLAVGDNDFTYTAMDLPDRVSDVKITFETANLYGGV